MPHENQKSLVEPMDEFNRELLGHVHPSDWTNPKPKSSYHLVVVGAGAAGLVSAAGAAGLGAKVAIIERHLMGGDCLNVGCVPSKGLIRAARSWHAARTGAALFGAPPVSGDGDFAEAMRRMRRLRAQISPIDGAKRFKTLGVDVFLGQGEFTGRDRIDVDGRTLRFKKAVIATGARAAAPPIPNLDKVAYHTNETIFSLERLPARLGIIGAGPIGCEMAQSFARFGSRVTLVEVAKHVLPREDVDAAHIIEAALRRDGVDLITNARLKEVRQQGDERILYFTEKGKPKKITVDELLIAVGRAPNLEGLGLEAAGVASHERGVKVDAYLRTTNKYIFAAGDICSPYQFTHAADAMARIVIQNALFAGRAKHTDLIIPWCTYTSPEVAHVGMYEDEATARGIEVEELTIPLSEVDRAVLDGEAEGFLRILLRKGKDQILGATLVAEHAGETIGELALAIGAKIGLGTIAKTIHPYPTQAEVIKKAGDAWNRRKLTPSAQVLLKGFFKLF